MANEDDIQYPTDVYPTDPIDYYGPDYGYSGSFDDPYPMTYTGDPNPVMPGDNPSVGYDPYSTGIDPFAGGYFDPTGSTPPNTSPNDTSGNYDPYSTGIDPLGGGYYDPTNPYDNGNPVFSATGAAPMPHDPNNPQIPNPPDPGSVQIPPFPSSIGNGIQAPYSPGGRMTQGNTFPNRQPTQQQNKTQPATRPSAGSAQPSSSNTAVNMGGIPGVSATLPSSQPFQYQPIAIARQGAPNNGAPGQSAPQASGQSDPLGGALGPFSTLNPYTRLNQDRKQNSPYPYDTTGV